MNHLFICSTPFQLITVINLKVTKFSDDEATLYILDHFHGNESVYLEISKLNLFSEIRLLKTKKINNHWLRKSKISNVLKIFNIIFYKKIANSIITDNTIFDEFWVSFMDESSWAIYLFNKNKNKNINLSFFEDGIGSYQLLSLINKKIFVNISHLLNQTTIFENIKNLYLYEPSLLLVNKYPNIKIKELPKIDSNRIKDLLNNIFLINDKNLDFQKYKYVYFDSPYTLNEINVQQKEMINLLSVKLSDSFVIKLHPRSHFINGDFKNDHVSKTRVGLELININLDLSQHVIISIFSTACFTPKLIFNQEPIIIFLFKIIELNKIKSFKPIMYDFLDEFRNNYSNPNRIKIPNSIKELEEILVELDNDIK